MKRLIAMLLTVVLALCLFAAPVAQAATYATATVKGGWLRLRAEPSYWAETISAYYTGTNVTILGGSGSWYHVSTPDGKTGYMHSDYLTITGSITGGQLDENTPAYVTSKNGKAVRMRTGPSTNYSIIASYAVGTPVTILISGDDWCKVRINGRTGYMMTEFITTSATSTPDTGTTTGQTAWVTSKNGLSVNLRTGAGKVYGAIASYPVGMQVSVLEWGRTWSKIRVNNVTGYMMTEFLTTSAPCVVSGVVLSDSSVWAGETLYATVVPSGATVSYEWLNDKGTTLGTGSAYTVRESDAGRRIRVRVTGTGSTTGTAVSGWATVQGGYVSTGYTLTGVTISDTTPTAGQTLTATLQPVGATANITWYRDDGVYVASGSTYTVHTTDVGRRLYVQADGTGSTSGRVTSAYTTAVTSAATTQVTLRSVSISDTTPTVGQTLSVSFNPANATADVTWYRANGSVAGYGSTYTVQQGDLGSSLYVYAVGNGSTKGAAVSSVTGKVTGSTSSTTKRINSAALSDTTPSVGQTIYVTIDPADATALITWYRDDDVILGYGSSYTVTSADAGHEMYVWVEGYGDTYGSCTSPITAPVGGSVTTSTDYGW